ncbi:autotransporter outer membrane beta-barrel domain-containing protein [Labrenzia sp. THAF82]|uniref:autotransporter outer membrane beta-barrel domain-containing protein n=1 Tax=Labrenzia sp. THAF82 TaxID=2587861 RepID=UPI0015658B31|nr:autotransporter outer membrane beta-barrel domain-containing protein [Labrenzia sp. THAF82]
MTPHSQSGSFQFSLRAFANALRRGRSEQPAAGGVTAAASQAAVNPERFAVFDQFSSSGTMSYTAAAPQPADTLAILSGNNGTATHDARQEGGARSGWDFWAQGTYAVTRNSDSDSQTGLFFAGLDYRYEDRAVFGVMGQLDVTDESNDSANTSADGVGWMAGPYLVLRAHQNLYLNGIMTYGRSYNSVNALGLFEDDFRTQRFLLQGGLTGDFRLNETTRISPFTRITYYYEEQQSYTDTLGRTIPSQDFDLGRLEFGPKVSFDRA